MKKSSFELRPLFRDADGVAMMEFAMALPLLLALGLGGMEAGNYALAHMRVAQIAAMTADGASRYRDAIDESDVDDLFLGALKSGESIRFKENGRIILSDLEPNADGSAQWIRWQRCAGDQTSYQSAHGRPKTASGSVIGNGTEIYNADKSTAATNPSSATGSTMTGVTAGGSTVAAQGGTAVMVAEAAYRYQPLIPNSLMRNQLIRYRMAFNVRQRVDQSLKNAGKMTPRSCGA